MLTYHNFVFVQSSNIIQESPKYNLVKRVDTRFLKPHNLNQLEEKITIRTIRDHYLYRIEQLRNELLSEIKDIIDLITKVRNSRKYKYLRPSMKFSIEHKKNLNLLRQDAERLLSVLKKRIFLKSNDSIQNEFCAFQQTRKRVIQELKQKFELFRKECNHYCFNHEKCKILEQKRREYINQLHSERFQDYYWYSRALTRKEVDSILSKTWMKRKFDLLLKAYNNGNRDNLSMNENGSKDKNSSILIRKIENPKENLPFRYFNNQYELNLRLLIKPPHIKYSMKLIKNIFNKAWNIILIEEKIMNEFQEIQKSFREKQKYWEEVEITNNRLEREKLDQEFFPDVSKNKWLLDTLFEKKRLNKEISFSEALNNKLTSEPTIEEYKEGESEIQPEENIASVLIKKSKKNQDPNGAFVINGSDDSSELSEEESFTLESLDQ
jgi:hypothetical protein